MSPFLALLRKEIHLIKKATIIPLSFVVFLYIVVAIIAYQSHMLTNEFIDFFMFIIVLLVFYPIVYILYSLISDSKQNHLWLTNPQSGWKLLIAKTLVGLLSFTVVVLVVLLLAMGTPIIFAGITRSFASILNEWAVFYFMGFFPILSASGLICLLWTLYYSLKPYSLWLARLAIPLLFVLLNWVDWTWSNSQVYHALFHWGEFSLFPNTGFFADSEDSNPVLGDSFYMALTSVLLFSIAGRLLDKRVEV